jgi:hypothetical protein
MSDPGAASGLGRRQLLGVAAILVALLALAIASGAP